ncbi:MAG TPA: hypothetical protein VIH00_12555 [Candidatus Limnocylindrales bacterium]
MAGERTVIATRRLLDVERGQWEPRRTLILRLSGGRRDLVIRPRHSTAFAGADLATDVGWRRSRTGG